MISEIKDVFSMIYNLYKSNIDKKYNEFNNYLNDIFEKTKKIQENYINILSTVKYGVVYENWDGEKTLEFLSKVEYEFKSERVYIREELKHINTIYNGELEDFVHAIFSIMYCDYVNRFARRKDIDHRFTRLISDAREYQFTFSKTVFLVDINDMLYDINKSWEMVCSTYFILKEKYKNKI